MHIGRSLGPILLASLFSLACSAQPPRYSAAIAGTDTSVCTVDHLANGPRQRCAITVAISQVENAVKRKITLPIEIATVNSLRANPGGHLVVLGEGATKFQRFLVYDIATRDLLINELCYFPAVSPNGSWIAYQRFIPPHGMEPLAVDLKIFAVDAVGGAQARTNSVFQGPSGSWMISDPRWSPSADLVLWGIDSALPTELVILRRTRNGQVPFSASVKRIDMQEVCNGNESFPEKSGRCSLSIENVRFNESGNRVEVTFKRSGEHGSDHKLVGYSLNAFVPVANSSGKGK